MVRVVIPAHLRRLAGLTGELELDVPAPVTLHAVINAIEAQYPMLTGTIRDKTGAIIPNAAVTVSSPTTNVAREVKSNSEGEYLAGALPPGSCAHSPVRAG